MKNFTPLQPTSLKSVLYLFFGALISIGSAVQAQQADIAGRLEPWPIPNWPAGKAVEIKLSFEKLPTAGTETLLGVTVTNGRFLIDLRNKNAIPAGAWGTVLEALRLDKNCSFTPTQTPAGAKAAIARLQLYVPGTPTPLFQLRGETRSKSGNSEDAEINFLVFVDKDVEVRGSGNCGGNTAVRINETLKKGWNLVQFKGNFSSNSSVVDIKVSNAYGDRFEVMAVGR